MGLVNSLTRKLTVVILLFASVNAYAETLDGWSNITFGMTPAQISRASGGLAQRTTVGKDDGLTWKTTVSGLSANILIALRAEKAWVISLQFGGGVLAQDDCSNTSLFVKNGLIKKYGNPASDDGLKARWYFDSERQIDYDVTIGRSDYGTTCAVLVTYIDNQGLKTKGHDF